MCFGEIKKIEYLKSVFENILYRDIITRYKLTSQKTIKEVALYTASNIGKELSYNKIKNLVGVSNARTIKEYFEYLENSYLTFLLSKFDYSLKKQIYSNKKSYLIDTGMIKLLGFRNSEDRGRILENLVFIKLNQKNNEIYFHKDKKECDFIIREGIKIKHAIQVTQSLEDEKTKQREIEGLLEAIKKYKLKEGLILTEDEESEEIINNTKIHIKKDQFQTKKCTLEQKIFKKAQNFFACRFGIFIFFSFQTLPSDLINLKVCLKIKFFLKK